VFLKLYFFMNLIYLNKYFHVQNHYSTFNQITKRTHLRSFYIILLKKTRKKRKEIPISL